MHIYIKKNIPIDAIKCIYMYIYIYICIQLIYIFKYIYIWLYMAIYTHICSIKVTKRCMRHLHSAFKPRKLVYTIPS